MVWETGSNFAPPNQAFEYSISIGNTAQSLVCYTAVVCVVTQSFSPVERCVTNPVPSAASISPVGLFLYPSLNDYSPFLSPSRQSGASTVQSCLQKKPWILFRRMILLSRCFCTFHSKQFIAQTLFSRFKRPRI